MFSSSTPLETLYRTRDLLADPDRPFSYHDWSRCTCGFIYQAAGGRTSLRRNRVTEGGSPKAYKEAIVALATALAGEDADDFTVYPQSAVSYVSHQTTVIASRRARLTQTGYGAATRADAIKLIDEGIAKIETAQLEAIPTAKMPETREMEMV